MKGGDSGSQKIRGAIKTALEVLQRKMRGKLERINGLALYMQILKK